MNRMVKYFFVFLFVSSCTYSYSQIKFNRSYDRKKTYDIGGTFIQTNNQGYLMGGVTLNTPQSYADCYIIKTNMNGDTLWTKIYNTGGDENISGLLQNKDGTYMVIGYSEPDTAGGNKTDYDVLLLKLNQQGDLIWQQHYGGHNNDYGDAILTTSDGGYIILGSGDSFTNGLLDTYLIKTDSAGNQQWLKHYGGPGYDMDDCFVACRNGGYAIAGYMQDSLEQNAKAWLLRTDSKGDSLWKKQYTNGAGISAFLGIDTLSDEGFALVGKQIIKNKAYGYFVKTDSAGNSQRQRIYADATNPSAFLRVKQLQDGSFICAGQVGTKDSIYSELAKGWLLKLTSSGDTLWNHLYAGYTEYVDSYLWDMTLTRDKGFAFFGWDGNNPGTLEDFWLVKTDSLGCDSYQECTGSTGIEQVYVPFEYSVSPNPADRLVNIVLPDDKNAELTISDLTGRTIACAFEIQGQNLELYTENLENGIYLYMLKQDSRVHSGKISIMH